MQHKKPIFLPKVCTLHGLFAQGRVEPATITLFQGWTRLTTDNHGEMHSNPLEGLFCAETLYMNRYEIQLNDQPVSHRFSAQLSANEWTSTGAVLKSGDAGNLPAGTLPKGAIEVRVLRKIEKGISEQIYVKNNGVPPRKVHLKLEISCPILDCEFDEEMKKTGTKMAKGICPQLSEWNGSLLLRFERRFGIRKQTPVEELQKFYNDNTPQEGAPVIRGIKIRISPAPGHPKLRIKIQGKEQTQIHAWALLGAREEFCLQLFYEPMVNGIRMTAPNLTRLAPLPRLKPDIPEHAVRITSDNSTFNLLVGQAMVDLRTLKLPLFQDTGIKDSDRYAGFIAGVPRYIGLFGRDTVISAWQSILFESQSVEPALSRVALFQGVKYDKRRDEEPDRMPHERRLNPLSQVGKMNRSLYYGDVTSTPFWILTLTALYRWTGERELIRRHQNTLERCVQWVLRRLKEGGGLIYYAPALPRLKDENRNQAWKDSGDAIVDEHGRIRTPPLALAEIQGYAFQALNEARELLSCEGVPVQMDLDLLRSAAVALKEEFNRSFWIAKDCFYALALDEKKNPLASRASNIGHCLGTGILSDSNLSSVVNALLESDLFSGWGIRTLSSKNPAFDPFSYHRGSIWPVENAIIANGMAKLGYHQEAHQIISAQLCLAALFQHMRLPEVFGGQTRSPEFPVPGMYNFANLLQAWSVSAISQFTQSLLGIIPRADLGTLYLDPQLPDWLNWVIVENLNIGRSRIKLRFQRDAEGETHWEVLENSGNLNIMPYKRIPSSAHFRVAK